MLRHHIHHQLSVFCYYGTSRTVYSEIAVDNLLRLNGGTMPLEMICHSTVVCATAGGVEPHLCDRSELCPPLFNSLTSSTPCQSRWRRYCACSNDSPSFIICDEMVLFLWLERQMQFRSTREALGRQCEYDFRRIGVHADAEFIWMMNLLVLA